MELTVEQVRENAPLAELSDEQAAAVVAVVGDVVGKTIGEVHRQYDETIKNATGVEREGSEKSYKYLERAAGVLREQLKDKDGLAERIALVEKERDAYREQAEKGADTAIIEKLKTAEKELNDIRTKFQSEKDARKALIKEHEQRINDLKVSSVLEGAVKGINFKKEIPADLIPVVTKNAIDTVRGYDHEFNEKGQLVFKDANGLLLKNDDLQPMTADELVRKHLASSIDTGHKVTGAGTGGGQQGGGGNGVTVDLSGVTNKQDGYKIIREHLAERGLVKGSTKYTEAETAILDAYPNFHTLPLTSK